MASPITDFDGKVAVVTGGAAGVGLALGRMLLDRGASVVIADIRQEKIDEAVESLEGRAAGDVIGVQTDVSDPASVEALADATYDRFGKVNVVFNNAGVGSPSAKIWEATANDWQWTLGVNTLGVAYGVITFARRMLASDEPGWIVNTTSGNGGIAPMPTATVYAASKAAVAQITETLDLQLRAESDGRLRAGLVFPSGGGLIATDMWVADQTRHAKWEREEERPEVSPETQAMKERAQHAAAANPEYFLGELDKLADAILDGILEDRFVLTLGDFDGSVAMLHARADQYARWENPQDAPAPAPAS